VSRETLRKWMTKAALWRPRSQRVKAIHVWRERRACFGELVMQDSSPFRWLEDRGPACHLIALSMMPPVASGTVHRARHHGRELANPPGMVTALWRPLPITPIKQHLSKGRPSAAPENFGEMRANAVRASVARTGGSNGSRPQFARRKGVFERLFENSPGSVW